MSGEEDERIASSEALFLEQMSQVARTGIVWGGNVDWRADFSAIFPLSPVAPTRGRTVYRLGAGLRAGDRDHCSGYHCDDGAISRWGTSRARLDQSLPRRDGRLYHWRDRRITAS